MTALIVLQYKTQTLSLIVLRTSNKRAQQQTAAICVVFIFKQKLVNHTYFDKIFNSAVGMPLNVRLNPNERFDLSI